MQTIKIKTIMKTLDYLHLDEQKVQGVVSALHSLLADFQVFYTNLRGFHWDIEGHGFLSCTASSKTCTTILPKRPIRSRNAS